MSSVQIGEDPFASLVPTKLSFINPTQAYANIFKPTARLFHNAETGESVGNKDVAPSTAAALRYEITIPGSGTSSSTDTLAEGNEEKQEEEETGVELSKKSKKRGLDKKKEKEKTCKSKDIAEMLKAQANVTC